MNTTPPIDILLVEDNPHDAEMSLRALRKRNFANSILHVSDGAAALDYLFGTGDYAGRDVSQKPKLVLLDLKMPKVDGLEVLAALKVDERTKAIPVVMLTSSHEELDLVRSYALGVNSYLVKPVEFGNFSEAVAQLGFYWLMLNETPK